ncbi:MAG: hypothetical protein WC197_04320 [Candidatus Gastranaerophilaceae bacterium]|jgi:hypothetical protein
MPESKLKSLDDVFNALENIFYDIKRLKLVSFRPDKTTAQALLEYLKMEKGNAKENFEIIFKKELDLYKEWIKLYCRENNCRKKEALEIIIEES